MTHRTGIRYWQRTCTYSGANMRQVMIREEKPGDFDAIDEVNRLAFGGEDEGRLVRMLREKKLIVASLVAVVDSRVVGHILFSELTVEGAARCVSLAPMAVHPDHQLRGIGSSLVRAGLDLCRSRGVAAVVVVGHRSYYPRFGFSADIASQLQCRYAGPSLMALELAVGGLGNRQGAVEYPEPFLLW